MMKVIDWEAVRRDYRTAKFTDIELAIKHNVNRETIGRNRKKFPDLWPQDLREAIREATDAALVTAIVGESTSKVSDTVLAMAEMNVMILRGQHKRIAELGELLAKGVRKANASLDADDDSSVQTLVSITNTAKVLTELEAKVFKLDQAPPEAKQDRGDRMPDEFMALVAVAVGSSQRPRLE